MNEDTICAVCGDAIGEDDRRAVYALERVYIHDRCVHRLPQCIRDDLELYISAIMNSQEGHKLKLTLRHLVDDTDEGLAMLTDPNYYLFIYNEKEGPYICVCNDFFNAVPAVIRGLNNRIESIMAVLHRGKFWRVKVRITVAMVDESGHMIAQREER
jgi:hypothetical protein